MATDTKTKPLCTLLGRIKVTKALLGKLERAALKGVWEAARDALVEACEQLDEMHEDIGAADPAVGEATSQDDRKGPPYDNPPLSVTLTKDAIPVLDAAARELRKREGKP